MSSAKLPRIRISTSSGGACRPRVSTSCTRTTPITFRYSIDYLAKGDKTDAATSTDVPGSSVTVKPNTSCPSLYATYPPWIPPVDPYGTRINPLQPAPPRTRQYTSMETVDAHWHNEQRSNRMKHANWDRYHIPSSKLYYGTEIEKETYRSYVRAVLQQQMSDQWSQLCRNLTNKSSECYEAIERDYKDIYAEQEQRRQKLEYLKKFRDGNKQIMEYSWSERRRLKTAENERELKILELNPINWSGTLT